MKGNFLAGMAFADITRLNEEALLWCARQAGRWRRAVACVPADEHDAACGPATRALEVTDEVAAWLCPRRKITFDGFVSYEGRRFGVPYWYDRRECRVSREGSYLHIYSDDLSLELAVHAVTWDRGDSWCEGQWAGDEPCELPSQRPTATIAQAEPPTGRSAFAKSGLGRCARGSRPTGAAPGLPDDRGNAWRLWTGDGSRGGAYARRGPRPDGAPERLRDEGSRQDGPREQGGDPGYFGSRPANAYLEGQTITWSAKRATRGFRNEEYLATAIFPGLGGYRSSPSLALRPNPCYPPETPKSLIFGYRCLSFALASALVNCQSTPPPRALRSSSHASRSPQDVS